MHSILFSASSASTVQLLITTSKKARRHHGTRASIPHRQDQIKPMCADAYAWEDAMLAERDK